MCRKNYLRGGTRNANTGDFEGMGHNRGMAGFLNEYG